MCGIAGVLGSHDGRLVEGMTASLSHRGPDGEGFHRRGGLQLGIRRLSVVDVEGGAQPVYGEDGERCVVFNGEIYNHRELRARLEGRGHVFRSRSDTEVIIHLYEEYGERCVEHLRGMFAFAVADGQKLFLARDRLGIKPLYYALAREPALFLFASEIKTILRAREAAPALDARALADKLVLNHLVGRRTFFEGVEALPPGHTMTVTLEGGSPRVEERCYYRLSLDPDAGISAEAAEGELTARLRSAVESHLLADVEVGLTLSGGLDSSLLALMMDECYGESIAAFTVADHAGHPDAVLSRAVAAGIRCTHEVVEMSFDDYLREIPACVLAEEQPTSLFGMPFFYLCRRAGASLKVCLNGEGADELFGGYPEYLDRGYKAGRMRKNLAAVRRLGLAPSPEAEAVVEELSSAGDFGEYLRRVFLVNQQDALVRQHLEIVDKYSMASGLELRVPFMDHELVEYVNRLPLGLKASRALGVAKYILKRVALHAYGGRLTDVVLREKLGFPSAGARHLSRFDELCEKMLPAEYASRHEWGSCLPNKRHLVMFDLFRDFFLERRGHAPPGFDIVSYLGEKAGA